MPVCMVLRNVECPASGVGEYHLPLCGVTTFHGHVMRICSLKPGFPRPFTEWKKKGKGSGTS